MIIGVDAGALSVSLDDQKVGTYRVTRELLYALGKIDHANTYRLYSFAPVDMSGFPKNMINVVLTPSIGFRTIRIPFDIALHPIDCFLGLSQSLPSWCPHPTIGFIHDIEFFKRPQLYKGNYFKLKQQTDDLVRRSRTIVAVSQTVNDDLVGHYYLDPKKIKVVLNGVVGVFTPKGAKIHRAHPYFLYVGRIGPTKNIPVLLGGFAAYVKQVQKPCDLVLAGSAGDNSTDVEKEIKRLGIEPRVKQTGWIGDDELSRYYRGAAAFVTASVNEGFCLPVVEAMACGCPLIVPDTPLYREIAGEAGLFTVPNDTGSIAKALTAVLCLQAKQSVKKSLAQAGKYSWEKAARELLTLIQAKKKI